MNVKVSRCVLKSVFALDCDFDVYRLPSRQPFEESSGDPGSAGRPDPVLNSIRLGPRNPLAMVSGLR